MTEPFYTWLKDIFINLHTQTANLVHLTVQVMDQRKASHNLLQIKEILWDC